MPLHWSGSTAISDADGTSSIIVDVSEVDSTNSQVDEGDATASFRNNDVHAILMTSKGTAIAVKGKIMT